jgi:hypothetical protein
MEAENRHHSTLIIVVVAIILGVFTFCVVSGWDTDRATNADRIHQGQ